jgi:hypothetical protein
MVWFVGNVLWIMLGTRNRVTLAAQIVVILKRTNGLATKYLQPGLPKLLKRSKYPSHLRSYKLCTDSHIATCANKRIVNFSTVAIRVPSPLVSVTSSLNSSPHYSHSIIIASTKLATLTTTQTHNPFPPGAVTFPAAFFFPLALAVELYLSVAVAEEGGPLLSVNPPRMPETPPADAVQPAPFPR